MNGWQDAKLGDVTSFLNRGISPRYIDEGGVLVLNQRCIRAHIIDFDLARRHDDSAKHVNGRHLQVGDVLVNSTGTGTLGRVAQVRTQPPEPTTVDSHVTIVRPEPGLFFPPFFGYMLRAIEDELKESGEGCGGQTELNRSVLAQRFVVRFPTSFAEQRRIVGILDEAFEGIAIAKANAEKNLQNARALFESQIGSVFRDRGEAWNPKTLASVCSLFVDSAHRTPKYQLEGIPALRPRDVVNGNLGVNDAARVSEEEYEIQCRRHRPTEGDIVYSRELSFGWAAVLPESPKVCLSQGMCLFRPQPCLDTAFLLYVLNGPLGREQAVKAAVGTAHPHINLGDIRAFRVPLPSLLEQKEAVQHLDALALDTKRLEANYGQKLVALDAFKAALLHQAFTGQL